MGTRTMTWRDTVIILGVPVDRVDMAATLEQIFARVTAYRQDPALAPCLVATVNVDFLVNALAYRPSAPPRHPELLRILRQAGLVTADGMPLVWLSRLLGAALPGRVPGADLVPELARSCAERQLSLYLLGGREETARQAAAIFQARHPALRIAGLDSPFVQADGEALADTLAADAAIVERVNRSGADILLIAFGNPKQEIWFHRNRQRLRVPVAVGIGGTFAFVTGDVARAPAWMQTAGLEWLFRLWAEPGRLWKRYGLGLLKFNLMIIPPLVSHARATVNRFFQPCGAGRLEHTVFTAGPRRIAWAALPPVFTRADLVAAAPVRDTAAGADALILDLARTHFLDAASLGFLVEWLTVASGRGAACHLTGVSNSLRRLFAAHRVADLLAPFTAAGYPDVVARLEERWSAPLAAAVFEEPPAGPPRLRLLGRLDAAHLDAATAAAAPCLTAGPAWPGLTVTVDFRACPVVDSSGFGFGLRLRNHLHANGRRVILHGLTPDSQALQRILKLGNAFPAA
ncbi:MAG: WecB/TagA/CpsF family glycosyltransferase [bacterium]